MKLSNKNTKGIICVFTFLLIFSCSNSFANTTEKTDTTKSAVPKLELAGYGGALLIHREDMEEIGQNPYFGTELRLGFQSTGAQYWQEALNYPIYGFGFYSGFYNNEAIGNPFAFFAFAELPYLRKQKIYLSNTIGVGVGFHINEYDSIDNPINVAIGTDVNAFINVSTNIRYKLSERWEIGTAFKFQHFSNGATKKPNLGLNMIAGEFSLAYYPGQIIEKFKTGAKPEPYNKFEYNSMFAIGVNTIDSLPDTRHLNTTFSVCASKRISYKRNIGIGIDVFYNEYIKYDLEIPESETTNSDYFSYAVFLSSDLIANKFRLTFQLGTYLYRPTDYSIPIYERVALRYYFIPNLFANASIKAHGAKAQFIEWGIGVAF